MSSLSGGNVAGKDGGACMHPVVYHGLCASCGRDLTLPAAAANGAQARGHAQMHLHQRERRANAAQAWATTDEAGSSASAASSAAAAVGPVQAVVLGGAHKTIHLSAAALRESSLRNSLALLRSRRLMCVLDLDHTLLHASSDARVAPFVGREEDLFAFELPAGPAPHQSGLMKTHFVKLRPGLGVFLSTLADLFDLHVYTMGVRAYADAVVAVMDPSHRIIKHRVVSRDETGAVDPALQAAGAPQASAVAKSLSRMHPCDAGLVCIVDDRVDVWGVKQGKQVLRVFEFQYFSGRGAEMNARPQQRPQSTAERKREGQLRVAAPCVRCAMYRSPFYAAPTQLGADAAALLLVRMQGRR